MEKIIYIFYDNDKNTKILLGNLYFDYTNGKEIYSFSFSNDFLKSNLSNIFIDTNLYLHNKRQYVFQNKKIFSFLEDMSPDRWGRTLIKRRETIRAHNENRFVRTLNEIDYLLEVSDSSRMGCLRLSLDGINYVSNEKELEVPPFEYIRKLEYASREYENDDNVYSDVWLKQLLGPGSSLGGARPKACVRDTFGDLWLAKFPSKHDLYDTGAWEKTMHDLASLCGLKTCKTKLEKYSNLGSTFLIKRFDRDKNERIHFISSMTALGFSDGDGSSTNKGYLDILSFIKMYSTNAKEDILELFKRVVFNCAISNTDDHFRNHAFLEKNNKLFISPIYDINPNPEGQFLALNIDNNSSLISVDTLLNSCKYYDLSEKEALDIINSIKKKVRENYKRLAIQNNINDSSIRYMENAFKFCED